MKQNPDEWEVVRAAAAIGRTSYYTIDFPFDWGWSKPELRDLLLQAYSTAVQAGLDVGFIDLRSARASQMTTLIVPCMQQVTTEDAAGVERFVRDGGTVYISYGGEPWFPQLGRFVGARLLIRYGLVEPPGEDVVKCVSYATSEGSKKTHNWNFRFLAQPVAVLQCVVCPKKRVSWRAIQVVIQFSWSTRSVPAASFS